MKNPKYIGDGVYVHVDEWSRLVLTTGHHSPAEADNVIVLEPEVLRELQRYVEQESVR